jgi:hypothetical protein
LLVCSYIVLAERSEQDEIRSPRSAGLGLVGVEVLLGLPALHVRGVAGADDGGGEAEVLDLVPHL